jgi:hypothetical protein
MAHYFADRVVLLDQSSRAFLARLVALGGYCTVSQARSLDIARSTRARLRWLEPIGFRPAEFIFDHDQKIGTFTECGYPVNILPQRGGKPYLREHFVLWLANGRIGVAMIDQPQPRAFSQLKQFMRQFQPALRHVPGGLELLIVTGSYHRQGLYGRWLRCRRMRKLSLDHLANAVKPYRIRRPSPPVAALLWPETRRHDQIHDLPDAQAAPCKLWKPYDGSCWGEN